MAGSAHARPTRAPVVIELSSDDEDGEIQMQATKQRSNNLGGSSSNNTLGGGGFTIASNHGLPDPDEFRISKPSTAFTHNGGITSNRTVSTKIPGAVYESDIGLFAREKTKHEKKFGFTNNESGERAKAVNTSKLQGTSRVSGAPNLLGSTVRGGRNTSNGALVPLIYDGSKPSPIFSENKDRGYYQATALDLSNDYIPSENLSNFPTRNGMSSRTPSSRPDGGLAQKGALSDRLRGIQNESREEEQSSITYSRISAEPSQMKRVRSRLEAYNTPRQGYSDSGSAILENRTTKKASTPALSKPATVITGAHRSADSGLSSSSADGAMKQSRQGHPDKVRDMLDKQVIPHVKKSLNGHRETLSKEDRDKIGLEVATQLMNEKSFRQNMSENGGMLSAEFEQDVAKRLQARIDNAAKGAMHPRSSHSTEAQDANMSDVGPIATEFNQASPTDAESPESEELFETSSAQFQTHQGALQDTRFRDESSPATSFSNGRAPSLSEGVDTDHNHEQDEMKLGRSTRGAAKDNYYSKKPRSRRTRAQMDPGDSSIQPTKTSQVVKAKKLGTTIPDPVTEVRAKLSIHAQQQLISRQVDVACQAQLSSMLRQRELHGLVPSQSRAGQISYKVLATNSLEDSISRQCQWSSQSGDVVTITWTSPSTFISGALTHYDTYNMQYNRYGNLVVGSTQNKMVRMVDGHRTIRPIVTAQENKDNSLAAMRTTQDPWRYASVVSSAFCEVNGYCFTASYDKTVKVWKTSPNGPSMELKGTWDHDAIVNFVVTSQHHDLVATACEAPDNAVRVYQFDESAISLSAYDKYNASRTSDKPGDSRMSEKWAYHPATMQWGRAKQVSKLLLVGYSPRATTVHGDEIPDAKRNTGELCCWNADTGLQVPISGVVSKNVFEVIWHTSQPAFLVATAPVKGDSKFVKTQVRLFTLNGAEDAEIFTCTNTLDCPAADINELTMMPAPTIEIGGYITASCTDGNTYVWDTKQGDEPIHVLPHGESIDNPDPNLPLEEADSGVKFAAWGQSTNRFYTGSSDGVVKVWDITRPAGHVFIRNILEAQGGIACGVFSWDYTQLMLGDATGHLHLIRASDDDDDFEVQESDTHSSIFQGYDNSSNSEAGKDKINQGESTAGTTKGNTTEEQKATGLAKQQAAALVEAKTLSIARERAIVLANNKAFAVAVSQRKLILPHLEPAPPAHLMLPGILNTSSLSSNPIQVCRDLIQNGIFREYSIPGFPHTKKIGQGPNYDELGLYCLDLHIDEDPSKPIRPDAILIPQWDGCSLWVSQEVMQEDTQEETLGMVDQGTLSRKRRFGEEDLVLDLSQLFLSDRSEELGRDVDVSEDCSPLLNLEEEGRDFIQDE